MKRKKYRSQIEAFSFIGLFPSLVYVLLAYSAGLVDFWLFYVVAGLTSFWIFLSRLSFAYMKFFYFLQIEKFLFFVEALIYFASSITFCIFLIR